MVVVIGSSRVVDLRESDFEEFVSNSDALALVDFWAAWCGPCRAVAPVIEGLAKDYGDKLAVYKINIDENATLAERFNIMSIPTVMIFKSGRAVETLVGTRHAQDYKSLIDKHS